MNYYLAASFADKKFAQLFAKRLAEKGYACYARWVFAEDDEEGLVGDALPPGAERFARQDLSDIDECEAFVLLTGDADSPGKTFEAGYALARGKRIFPVGTRAPRSIFRTLFEPMQSVEYFLQYPFDGEL